MMTAVDYWQYAASFPNSARCVLAYKKKFDRSRYSATRCIECVLFLHDDILSSEGLSQVFL